MTPVSNLAICTWSLRPTDPLNLAEQIEQTGINRVQIALDPLREQPAVWASLPSIFAQRGISIISGMFGTADEDYSTLESSKRTGGVVPDATWDENRRNIESAASIAQKLALKLVTFHAGFLPNEPGDRNFQKLLRRISWIADLFASKGTEIGFETGQETAETLRAFLQQLGMPNVGVNFDPANMILYDQGDPIAALRVLGPWLKQCHIKDAVKAKTPGAWGEEVVVGTGQVNWRAFFQTAERLGFRGNFAIEREAGERRLADICAAREYVAQFLP